MKTTKNPKVADLNRAIKQTKFWWLDGDTLCIGTKKAGELHRFPIKDFSELHPDLPEELTLLYYMYQKTYDNEAFVSNGCLSLAGKTPVPVDYLSFQRDICITPQNGYRLRLTSSSEHYTLLGNPEVSVTSSYVRVYGEALLSDTPPAALAQHYSDRPVPLYLSSKGTVSVDTDPAWMDSEYSGWRERYALVEMLSLGPETGAFIFGKMAAPDALDLPDNLTDFVP